MLKTNFKYLGCLLLLTGCSSSGLIISDIPHSEVNYSVVYVIHADANYLYHENGIGRKANEKVLEEARQNGEQASGGEVFIFHQLPERNFLGIFPRKNRELLLYRNGESMGRQKYHPGNEMLSAEAGIYRQFSGRAERDVPLVFFYFGHEIPNSNGYGYNHSLPDVPVNTKTFADGLEQFLRDRNGRYFLTGISTCNNGSPAMMARLAGVSDYALASPQNLHLSHFDTQSLRLLETQQEITASQLARSIAEETFQRLSASVHTPVTLAVYDLNEVQNYVSDLYAMVDSSSTTQRFFMDNIDCANRQFFRDADFSSGVTTWFRPSRFGRNNLQQRHSGWGCPPGD